MEGKGVDIFDLSDFNFMPIGTEMVGKKIRDTLKDDPFKEL